MTELVDGMLLILSTKTTQTCLRSGTTCSSNTTVSPTNLSGHYPLNMSTLAWVTSDLFLFSKTRCPITTQMSLHHCLRQYKQSLVRESIPANSAKRTLMVSTQRTE